MKEKKAMRIHHEEVDRSRRGAYSYDFDRLMHENFQRYSEADESVFLESIQHAFGKQTVHHRKRRLTKPRQSSKTKEQDKY